MKPPVLGDVSLVRNGSTRCRYKLLKVFDKVSQVLMLWISYNIDGSTDAAEKYLAGSAAASRLWLWETTTALAQLQAVAPLPVEAAPTESAK
ncbi:TPA: hypothetical protein ACH3X1_015740 [Trebouxia sp. C0004]